MIRRPAFTLVELLIVILLIGVLASIGTRSASELVHKANVARAAAEIRGLERTIAAYQVTHDGLPSTLAAAGAPLRDPWGNPYVYSVLGGGPGGGGGGGGGGGKGDGASSGARKDRFLVPLNSDYDLYSKGRDGKSLAPLTAATSRDDIVRALDGAFVGLAEEF